MAGGVAVIFELTKANGAIEIGVVAGVKNFLANRVRVGAGGEVDAKGVIFIFTTVAVLARNVNGGGNVDAVAIIVVFSWHDSLGAVAVVFWIVEPAALRDVELENVFKGFGMVSRFFVRRKTALGALYVARIGINLAGIFWRAKIFKGRGVVRGNFFELLGFRGILGTRVLLNTMEER